ncbi:hypothetical protein [uncultured Algibacter sp.]|uniref:hypothetical protein n=1 Tax=uncultured Algibacter sp. TaxID=298659 RepID=UPI002618C70F|nr:hypothetical protein [uncultured Algibacter sp.]
MYSRKNQFKENPSFFIVFIALLICSISTTFSSCTDNSEDKTEIIEEVEEEEVATGCLSGKIFNEEDGIVRVDLKNPSAIANGWTTASTLSGYEGTGYLIWTASDNFNTPGAGTIKFSIKINNPGTYQFVWRSRIGDGTSNTDFNDSWLKINGNDFYGEKAGTNERVYPKGSGKTPNPEGASKDGWFKIYMNKVGEWFWRSSTSDNDPHDIFTKFDAAGIFDVEISGRSKSHAIDQFVLFKTDKSLSAAQSGMLSEITCK